MAQVVLVDDRIADEADDDGRDEEDLSDLVLDDRIQHDGHAELWAHDYLGVDEDGEMQAVDETGYCRDLR